MSVVYLSAQQLLEYTSRVFQACGLTREASETAADVLGYADLSGFDTHGICNLERIYVARLLDGRIDPTARPEVVADTGATAVVDGHNGLGLVVAAHAMDLAIAKAREFGIGAVAVRRSSHFGSAGFYTAKALAANMIGIAMTNLGTQVVARPPNGAVKMLGTNPISVAAPATGFPPYLLDMSTTVVATGKIRAAQQKGEAIPPGWLADEYGNPVTDPGAYERGTGHLLFLGGRPETGGYKGYGLALLVDILCGVLAGAAVGPHAPGLEQGADKSPTDDNNIGHFFLALDVAAFRPLEQFQEQMNSMLGALLHCPPNALNRRVSYPGYPESDVQRRRTTEGIPLEERLHVSLCALAKRLQVAPPFDLSPSQTGSKEDVR